MSLDEHEETISNSLDLSATDTRRTTTSASPLLPLPDIPATTAESNQRRTSTDSEPPLKSTKSDEKLVHSEETAPWSSPSKPPVVKVSTETNNALNSVTIQETFVSISAAPSVTNPKSSGFNGDLNSRASSEKAKDGMSTINPIVSLFSKTKAVKHSGVSDYVSVPTTVSSDSRDTKDMNYTPSSPFMNKTDNSLIEVIKKDNYTGGRVSTEPRGFPELQMPGPTVQTSSSREVQQESSLSVARSPSTTTSVLLSGVLLQPTRLPSNGEHYFVFPSSSSSSSPCDTLDPSIKPSACLHDPPFSSTPVLSASALDSQHAASALLSAQNVASPSVPTLPSSTLPHLPHPSPSGSGWDSDSVSPTISVGSNSEDGVWSSDPSVVNVTPPLQTEPVLTELSQSSLSKVSLSLSPTLQPSVVLSSEFVLSDGLSKSGSLGFDDSRYATGSTVEVLLPAVSDDGFAVASDVDIECGCSLEPSASSSWSHVSLHDPPLSSAWNATSLTLDSSLGLLSTSGFGIHSLLHSPSVVGSDGPSLDQPLRSLSHISPSSSFPEFFQVTHSDLHVSVDATFSTSRDVWLSAVGRNTAFPTSSLPFSPTASPPSPTAEGQVFDSSSVSGSALLPDSQEAVDHEWDKAEASASGQSGIPYTTKVVTTTAPVVTVGSVQNSGDLEEQSSTFYFESGSGATPEVGGSGSSAISEVTSSSPRSLGGTDRSSSEQGESLYDNETSSDFSISDRTERESEEEEPVEGKN